MNQLFNFDKQFNYPVIGTDEAGRGPAAGGVYAAAVYFNDVSDSLIKDLEILNDSKKLTPKKRESIYDIIRNSTINEIVCVEVDEIETINILNSSLKAMKLACEGVIKKAGIEALTLVDGNKLIKNYIYPQKYVIKGDSMSASIAAASILAKVTRDRYMQKLDEDYVEELFMTSTHHYIMFFTNKGRVYRLKAYEIPEAGRTARGTAIINLLQLMPDEKITAMIPLKDYEEGKYLFMATEKGLVKKTSITEYANVRKTGLAAISLREDDRLIEVKVTDNNQDILLVTKYGQCIRFNETDVRATGRVSMGVRGMNLGDSDVVIGMQISSQGKDLLIVSEKGMGKRTDMEEFTRQNRGGKGVKCYKITEKTGNVVGMKAVDEDSEIMIINTEGIIIRMKCSDISTYGRITSGVKLINLPDYDKVASVAKVRKASAEIDGEQVEIGEEEEEEKTEE